MKVLFLDIDGVLFELRTYAFSPSAFNNLNTLLEKEPDLNIVIDSSWRHFGLDQLKRTFKANGVDPDRLVSITGNEHGERGVQIQAWLDKHPEVTSFVCIDDESDFSNIMDRLVKTNPHVGITSEDIRKAIEVLKKSL